MNEEQMNFSEDDINIADIKDFDELDDNFHNIGKAIAYKDGSTLIYMAQINRPLADEDQEVQEITRSTLAFRRMRFLEAGGDLGSNYDEWEKEHGYK